MKGPTLPASSQPQTTDPSNVAGSSTRHEAVDIRLHKLLAAIARRWWRRRMLEGIAAAAAVALLLVIALCAYMIAQRFEVAAVHTARQLAYLALPLLALVFLLPRLLRRMSVLGAARHAESSGYGGDALLVSAAELLEKHEARAARKGRSLASGSLQQALLKRASDDVERNEKLRQIESPRSRRAALGLLAIALLVLISTNFAPAPIRHALAILSAPDRDPSLNNPFQLRVKPGDLKIVEGEDQAIIAHTLGFAPGQVELLLRRDGDTQWQSLLMNSGIVSGSARPEHADTALGQPEARFETLLFNLDKSFEYYVKSGAIESSRHSIEIVPRPKIARIDLLYRFPERTGRPPLLVQNEADIRGLRGAEVEVRVVLERPLPSDAAQLENTATAPATQSKSLVPASGAALMPSSGELVIDAQHRLPLQPVGAELHATLTLEKNGTYRVELPIGTTRREATLIPVSAEHAIFVHDDLLPAVTLEAPGRDTKVTAIEEIDIALKAEDDVALREVELVININGAEERFIRIDIDNGEPQLALGSHLLALEALSLAPGDLISYYVRASDAPGDPARMVNSDIYFLDVRPFERSFRRANGGGGGGGGGAGRGGADSDLTAQQRSLVVALFNLRRDTAALPDEERRNRTMTLEQAQERIRERVEAIVRRMGARQFIARNEAYKTMADELPKASAQMLRAQTVLAGGDADSALRAARAALLHLQRADAAFRDVRVALSRNGNARGGAQQNDLANLFRLEMDKFRSRYQGQQHAQPQTSQQQMDDALRKLRELARRQQRELERASLRAEQGQSGPSSQKALAAEVERLVRELERLTRQRETAGANSDALKRAADKLRQAQQAMNEAQTRNGTQAAQDALESIREARRQLDQQQDPKELGGSIADAQRRTQEALDSQRNILDELQQALARNDASESTLTRLGADKLELADRLRQIAADLDGLRARARLSTPQMPSVKQALERAAQAMGEKRLAEEMRRSAQAMLDDPRTHAQTGETGMRARIEATRDALQQASSALSDGRKGNSTARQEALQELIRGMDTDRRRLARKLRETEESRIAEVNRSPISPTQRGGERAGAGQAGEARRRAGQDGQSGPAGTRGQQPGNGANAGRGATAGGAAGPSRGAPSDQINNAGGQNGGWAQGPVGGASDGGFRGRANGYGGTGATVFRTITEQMLERMRALRSLRDDFDELDALAGNVDGVIDAIETLAEGATNSHLQQLASEHEALLAELKRLEAALRSPQAKPQQSTVARNQAEVAPRYEPMVEQYFRALSDPQPAR